MAASRWSAPRSPVLFGKGKKSFVNDDGGYFRMISVTRRFNCLPSGSSVPSGFRFGATGLRGPKPTVVKPATEKRSFITSHPLTAVARRSDKV